MRIQIPTARGQREQPRRAHARHERVQILVHVDIGELVVVQARAAQLGVVEIESERADQVQARAGIRAQADDIAGVWGDFRFV